MKQLILISLIWAAIFAAFLFALSIGANGQTWKYIGLIASIVVCALLSIWLLSATIESDRGRHIEFKDEMSGITREDEIY